MLLSLNMNFFFTMLGKKASITVVSTFLMLQLFNTVPCSMMTLTKTYFCFYFIIVILLLLYIVMEISVFSYSLWWPLCLTTKGISIHFSSKISQEPGGPPKALYQMFAGVKLNVKEWLICSASVQKNIGTNNKNLGFSGCSTV